MTLTMDLDFALWDASGPTDTNEQVEAELVRVYEKELGIEGMTFQVKELDGPAGGNPLVTVTWPDEATKARFMSVYDPDGDLA